jgi:hypothetical protein
LTAAKLAEASASRTATAAQQIVMATRTDLADATADAALAEVDEAEARDLDRQAADRAFARSGDKGS